MPDVTLKVMPADPGDIPLEELSDESHPGEAELIAETASDQRLGTARSLTEDVAVLISQTHNHLSRVSSGPNRPQDLTSLEIVVDVVLRDPETWNAPDLGLYVEMSDVREVDRHLLRNLISEGLRNQLIASLGPYPQARIDIIDVQLRFPDGVCIGHTRKFGGEILASWGDGDDPAWAKRNKTIGLPKPRPLRGFVSGM